MQSKAWMDIYFADWKKLNPKFSMKNKTKQKPKLQTKIFKDLRNQQL